ncbi:MAG: aminotransferase class III-fold pyridoxal phosphate-dependent enzyme [Patescibacteria group bacterium]|nr:aminotransferase class III-fold pyridoxal phosphate-dependent enzyme [Patescibacteria group bacterium]
MKKSRGTGQKLWKKAKRLIPGGNQLLSKRAEMFLPEQWPAYYSKSKGCEVWDMDGRKYVDMSTMGVGSCLLGYADADVDKAVKERIDRGSMSTLNTPEEVELAELLCRVHPWADMVRYARTGGEAMAIAVRIARAYTGREKVAFCGYHGWADWYLSANLASDKALDGHLLSGLQPKGVPRGLKGTMLPFHYNHIEELEAHVKKHGKKIGVIVMEPTKGEPPGKDFLKKVRKIADKLGAVLIFDEITVGWKLTYGGAHLLYKVNPDIAVFSKGMSNGYAMAAIIGRRNVMQSAQDSFISSTYWTEGVGPAAALATLKKMKRVGLARRLHRVGMAARAAWQKAADKHGVPIIIGGTVPISSFNFVHKDSQALRTLFTQEMLERGYLAGTALFASYAHTDAHLKKYAKAVDDVFAVLKIAVDTKTVRKRLKGPIAHAGFSRLN